MLTVVGYGFQVKLICKKENKQKYSKLDNKRNTTKKEGIHLGVSL